ncbi:MAG: hypothetical protein KAZ88_10365 [Acidimicrobiia bacterium]|nr:hypothetical protein [Acidimicrobiia bacterium]MBP8181382.1 hypothetical protein [Acidimicrobiia bacterium]
MTDPHAMFGRIKAAGIRTVFAADGCASQPAPDSSLEWISAPAAVARTLAMAAGELGPTPGVYFDGDWSLVTGLVEETADRRVLPVNASLSTLRTQLPPAWFSFPEWDDRPPPTQTADGSDAAHRPDPADAAAHVNQHTGDGAGPGRRSEGAQPPGGERPDIGTAQNLLDGVAAILLGPGVRRAGRESDWRAFAVSTGLGVFNTVGAKGFFEWDDPLHLGTVGLQGGDAATTGLPPRSLLAVGLDRAELPGRAWEPLIKEEVSVHAARLMAERGVVMADRSDGAGRYAARAFYDAVSAVALGLYSGATIPDGPAVLMGKLSAILRRHRLPISVVAASPGPGGFLVGRMFPTPAGANLLVPARSVPGAAVGLAVAAALARPDLIPVALVDDLACPVTNAMLEWARRQRLAILVVHWQDRRGDPDELSRRLVSSVTDLRSGNTRDRVLIAEGHSAIGATIRVLVEAFGPIELWDGHYNQLGVT